MLFFGRQIVALFVICVGLVQISTLLGQSDPFPPVVYVAKLPQVDALRLYDVRTGFSIFITQRESIGVVDVSPNQEILVTTHAQVGSVLNLIDTTHFGLEETVHGIDDNPMWSPNADRIAYRRYYYQGGLYIFTRGRWPPRPLDIRATAISWSPDGTVLAYSRWSETTNQEEIRTIDPITREDSLLAGWRKPVRFMRWSQDGAHIAVVTISGDLYVLDIASQTFTSIFEGDGQVRSVQWLPDDNSFGVLHTVRRNTQLHIYSVDGSLHHQFSIPDLESTSSFDWFVR